jgi:hypothetical protein
MFVPGQRHDFIPVTYFRSMGKAVTRASLQKLPIHTMKFSRVRFRKDRDGTVIAFENCGCEADAMTFRPCHIHAEDREQGARLKAEAHYRVIQKHRKEDR